MCSKLFMILFVALLLPGLLFAAGGKIKGKVVDKDSKEPLVGATVAIVGTSMGAAVNTDGEYTILNVVAGTYQLKASFVGYQTVTLSNVRVNSDLTTEENFELYAEGVTAPAVDIIAERPLVNKSATNAVRIVDADFFDKVPIRGLSSAVAIQPGVVQQNGEFHIRGSRPDEVGFQLEGVGVNDVLFGGRAVNLSDQAVEQVQIQAGGYNAEYGGANAGIVSAQLKTGSSEQWKASALLETDNYTKQGNKSLGGYSYGYSDYTATLGGPLLGKSLTFFGSIENTFYRDAGIPATFTPVAQTGNSNLINANPQVWGGFNFSGANALIAAPGFSIYHPTDATIADTLNLVAQPGNLSGGMYNKYGYSASFLSDLGSVQLRASGSYTNIRSKDGITPGNASNRIVSNILDAARTPLRKEDDGFGNLKVSHFLNPTTYYQVSLNYFYSNSQIMDPDFTSNMALYGDSLANAQIGYLLQGQSLNFPSWSVFGGNPNGLTVREPGVQESPYGKTLQTSIGGRADFTTQMDKHELKAGGEYTRYTVRRYYVPQTNAFSLAKINQEHPGDAAAQQAAFRAPTSQGGIDNYGYDVMGNSISSDIVDPVSGDITDFGPPHPVFAAAYLEDKVEMSDIVLNLGLRYDYIKPDSWTVDDPGLLTTNDNLYVPKASNLKKTPATNQISPRLGFSFPVTDRTVFHAQYGKFIQETQLSNSYLGGIAMWSLLKSGLFISNSFGWGLKPERTTQYEMGFSQQISDFASFDITGFYKDIMDQITFIEVAPAAGSTIANYGAYINGDFSTVKGVEVKFTLRRTNRIAASINFTFSDARGTGSNPASASGAAVTGSVPYLPRYVFPSNFDQANRGSFLFDYRFDKNDGGPILERLGLNLLATFNSGHAYTQFQLNGNGVDDVRNRIPTQAIGASTTPWFFQLDARLDKPVTFGGLDANFYIYVINLLGTNNIINVFQRTGDASDDGWLSAGGASLSQGNPQYAQMYRSVFLGDNSSADAFNSNFGPPRQFRFGVKLNY